MRNVNVAAIMLHEDILSELVSFPKSTHVSLKSSRSPNDKNRKLPVNKGIIQLELQHEFS